MGAGLYEIVKLEFRQDAAGPLCVVAARESRITVDEEGPWHPLAGQSPDARTSRRRRYVWDIRARMRGRDVDPAFFANLTGRSAGSKRGCVPNIAAGNDDAPTRTGSDSIGEDLRLIHWAGLDALSLNRRGRVARLMIAAHGVVRRHYLVCWQSRNVADRALTCMLGQVGSSKGPAHGISIAVILTAHLERSGFSAGG